MYEIAVLNPRRKRRSKSKRSKAMPFRNSKGRFVKRSAKAPKRRKHKRHANPIKKVAHKKRSRKVARKSAKRRPAVGYVVGTKRIRRRKLNPRRRHHYAKRRHRNPRFSVSGITSQLVPAAIGAGGAIALDVLLGYVSPMLPATITTGYAKHGLRIAGALGVGFVAKKFLGSKGHAVAEGALIVALYKLMTDVLVQYAPAAVTVGLGDYEEVAIDNTADQIGAYMDPAARLGAYLPDGSIARSGPIGAYMAGPVDDYFDRDGSPLSGMDY